MVQKKESHSIISDFKTAICAARVLTGILTASALGLAAFSGPKTRSTMEQSITCTTNQRNPICKTYTEATAYLSKKIYEETGLEISFEIDISKENPDGYFPLLNPHECALIRLPLNGRLDVILGKWREITQQDPVVALCEITPGKEEIFIWNPDNVDIDFSEWLPK